MPIHINDEVLQLPVHKSETSWFHDPVSIQINDEVFGFFSYPLLQVYPEQLSSTNALQSGGNVPLEIVLGHTISTI